MVLTSINQHDMREQPYRKALIPALHCFDRSRTHQDRITLASQRMPSSTSLGTRDPLTVAKSICDAPIERDARLENQPGSIHSESFVLTSLGPKYS